MGNYARWVVSNVSLVMKRSPLKRVVEEAVAKKLRVGTYSESVVGIYRYYLYRYLFSHDGSI